MLFIDSAVPMVLQWPTLGALTPPSRGTVWVDAAGRQLLAGIPDDRCRPANPPAPVAIEHRSARQHDRRDVHCVRAHDHGWRGLVATGRRDDAVEKIAVEAFDRAEIGGLRSSAAVGRFPVSWIGWTGNSIGMPPASRMRYALASSR